jgi:hypothetical protein
LQGYKPRVSLPVTKDLLSLAWLRRSLSRNGF